MKPLTHEEGDCIVGDNPTDQVLNERQNNISEILRYEERGRENVGETDRGTEGERRSQ